MLLAIDIGNTDITIGIFDGSNLVTTARFLSDKNLSVDDYSVILKNHIDYNISSCIIASVVDGLDKIIYKAVKVVFNISSLIFTNNINTGLNLVEKHSHVGVDRIANVVAAYEIYKDTIIVIDIGTAITFDIINSKKEFLSGLIAPGINLQLKALSNNTSKLPELSIEECLHVIGKNTKESIMAGVIIGTASMIDGMLKKSLSELNESAKIILTGGMSEFMSKYIEHPISLIDKNLTIKGLNCIYNLNSTP